MSQRRKPANDAWYNWRNSNKLIFLVLMLSLRKSYGIKGDNKYIQSEKITSTSNFISGSPDRTGIFEIKKTKLILSD